MRKFDLSLRSSRSSYFATFRHQLTILSKTDALDEEKWLNMLGTFVKDWFRYESHFVHCFISSIRRHTRYIGDWSSDVCSSDLTQGQGHFTVFAQLVADIFGVKVEDVRVVTGDTREFHWGTGTFASRGAVVAGSACHAAALAVREKILSLAGSLLNVPTDQLELRGGRVRVVGSADSGIELRS